MKHQIKLQDLPNIINNLNTMAEKDIPIKLSYKLSKLNKKLQEEQKNYEEQSIKIANKYGERNENGELKINQESNTIPIIMDKIQDFQKETQELNSLVFEVEFEPINIEEFDNINISPNSILYLVDKFITD